MRSLTDGFVLANGNVLPCIGYGTWRTPAGDVCINGVVTALRAGYRHIDTAAVYQNEESVGDGIIKGGIDRKDIFLTSKLWNSDQGKHNTLKAFELSLKKLKTDYLDLYLIHWPVAYDYKSTYPQQMLESWHIMEELYRQGRTKAIGVSNFLPHHIEVLQKECSVLPMVNQIELHLGYHQQKAVDYCKEKGIVLQAWSPLCKGKCFDSPIVQSVAKDCKKTAAQVLIRWCLQKGYVPLPKSVTPSRIVENTKVFDFALSAEQMAALDTVNDVARLGSHPDDCGF